MGKYAVRYKMNKIEKMTKGEIIFGALTGVGAWHIIDHLKPIRWSAKKSLLINAAVNTFGFIFVLESIMKALDWYEVFKKVLIDMLSKEEGEEENGEG